MPRPDSIRAKGLENHLGPERYAVFVRMMDTDVSDASAAKFFDVTPNIIRKWKAVLFEERAKKTVPKPTE